MQTESGAKPGFRILVVSLMMVMDGSPAQARLFGPHGAALDQSGNLYFAERDSHTIRKMSPNGEIITLAGKAGVSGFADGKGAKALFNYPGQVAVDKCGNIYSTDLPPSTYSTCPVTNTASHR